MSVLTADRNMLKYCERSQVQLVIDSTEPVNVEVWVVDRWLLSFNLILRNGAILPAEVVSFAGRKTTMCTAIYLDEPDSCAEFNQTQNLWTAKWKGSRG